MSVQESFFFFFFYKDIKFMLSKFYVDFCSEGFSFSVFWFLASQKRAFLILHEQQTIVAREKILLVTKQKYSTSKQIWNHE